MDPHQQPPVDQPMPPIMPTPEPATPSVPVYTQPVYAQPVTSVGPTPPLAPAKKKSLLWLWTALSIVVLLIAALVVSYMTIKSSADTKARLYTTNVKIFLADTYDVAASPATDPAEVSKAVKAKIAPSLQETDFGNVSREYVAAQKLQTEVNAQVNTITNKIDEFANVYDLYKEYGELYTDLNSINSKASVAITSGNRSMVTMYLNEFETGLQAIVDLIDSAEVPDELQSDVDGLEAVYVSMHEDWGDLISAFNDRDVAAYDAAFTAFTRSSNGLAAAQRPIASYYDDLSSKTTDAAKDLQSFTDSIK